MLEQLPIRFWSTLQNVLLMPLNQQSEYYWPFLLSALVAAALAYAWSGGRSLRGFLALAFSAKDWWHRSARADYAYYLVNAVLYLLLVGPWLLSVAAVAYAIRDGLAALFGPGPVFAGYGLAAVLLYTFAHFVARDFGRWFGHWAQHRVPLLWEFHKTHHSAEALVPVTNARAHPVDLVIMALCGNFCVGVVAGIAIHLCSGRIDIVSVFGTNVLLVAFDFLGSNLRHSPVWLSYGPRLERWLISPAQHQLHHSIDPRHWHRNMGFVLAVWDRLFGTLYVPQGREAVVYGLGDGSEAAYHSVWGLYWVPVRRAWQRLTGVAVAAPR